MTTTPTAPRLWLTSPTVRLPYQDWECQRCGRYCRITFDERGNPGSFPVYWEAQRFIAEGCECGCTDIKMVARGELYGKEEAE